MEKEALFKKIDSHMKKIDKINLEIRERVGLFKCEEEVAEENQEVKELLDQREGIIVTYQNLYNQLSEKEPKPFGIGNISTSYFMENFSDTQEALDYINKKLNKVPLMSGTRELFTGLAYSSMVQSYSYSRLEYAKWKIEKVFKVKVEIKYN